MIIGIIPARYQSTRFPGKPLAEIRGKSMVQRVYEQASRSSALSRVIVATDDSRIYRHVLDFGGNAVITGAHHTTGTDRCREAMEILKEDAEFIINIQGDEPFIAPSQIDTLAEVLQSGQTELATLVIPVTEAALLTDPGEVKVALNNRMEALYFSRSIIPYLQNIPADKWHEHHTYYRHAGMYAYRRDILAAISTLPVSSLEKAESLEQLRWLENGYKIRCAITEHESYCVDTPEDILRILERYPTDI